MLAPVLEFLAMAVGIVTKNAPFDNPLKAAKRSCRVNVDETGQIANVVKVLSPIAKSRVFVEPSLSQAMPELRRPIAMHTLKQATIPAAVLLVSPIECATKGKKNEGTKSGNTPIAPAVNRQEKVEFRNNEKSTEGPV
jgi:hypothetical protein